MARLLDTIVDGVITIDADGVILAYNRSAEQIFGHSAKDAIGQNVSMLMPESVGKHHDHYIQAYLHTGVRKIIGIGRQVEGLRKNGEVFAMELAISESVEAGTSYFTGIVRDVSERQRMEEALREERNLVSAILDTGAALIVVSDRMGRVLRFNRSCERTTGFRFEDVEHRPIWDVLIPDEHRTATKRAFALLVKSGDPMTYEHEWLTRDGRRRLIAWSNTVLRDAAGNVTHVIGTGIDITEQRRAEEGLVAVSEAERRLIGQDLHDVLGQQLTGLTLLSKALAQRLEKHYPEGVEDARGLTELARDAVTEAKRLAHGLYPTGIEQVGLSDSLADMADMFRRVYQVDCEFHGGEELDDVDQSACMNLYRISQEAVNNAIKHAGGSRINISLQREGGDLVLSVEDDGVGIPENVMDGEGMGLSIMRYRAQMIGASFEIVRPSSGGTVIWCALPFGDAPV